MLWQIESQAGAVCFITSGALAQVAHELDFFIDFHAYHQRNPNVFGSERAVLAM